MAGEHRLRDGTGLDLPVQRICGARDRGGQGKSAEQGCLVVRRIVCADLRPGFRVGRQPSGLVALGRIPVVRLERRHVRLFPRGRQALTAGLLQQLPTAIELLGRRVVRPEGVKVGHRLPPVGQRALRLGLGCPSEYRLCLGVRHVVKQRQPESHLGAGLLAARDGEGHTPHGGAAAVRDRDRSSRIVPAIRTCRRARHEHSHKKQVPELCAIRRKGRSTHDITPWPSRAVLMRLAASDVVTVRSSSPGRSRAS